MTNKTHKILSLQCPQSSAFYIILRSTVTIHIINKIHLFENFLHAKVQLSLYICILGTQFLDVRFSAVYPEQDK